MYRLKYVSLPKITTYKICCHRVLIQFKMNYLCFCIGMWFVYRFFLDKSSSILADVGNLDVNLGVRYLYRFHDVISQYFFRELNMYSSHYSLRLLE